MKIIKKTRSKYQMLKKINTLHPAVKSKNLSKLVFAICVILPLRALRGLCPHRGNRSATPYKCKRWRSAQYTESRQLVMKKTGKLAQCANYVGSIGKLGILYDHCMIAGTNPSDTHQKQWVRINMIPRKHSGPTFEHNIKRATGADVHGGV